MHLHPTAGSRGGGPRAAPHGWPRGGPQQHPAAAAGGSRTPTVMAEAAAAGPGAGPPLQDSTVLLWLDVAAAGDVAGCGGGAAAGLKGGKSVRAAAQRIGWT